MAHTFVRHSELCRMRWDELDIEKKLWLIPAERMKTGIPHVVPLSSQSLEILDELRTINRESGFNALTICAVGSAEVSPVAMAKRNTCPTFCKSRWAVSIVPLS